MKKRVIGVVGLVVLVSFGFVFGSYDKQNNRMVIEISKGWNIVPSGLGEIEDSSSPIKFKDFKYGYVYDIDKNDYVFVLKDGDWTQRDFGFGEWVMRSSMWVYSEKEGNYILEWEGSGFNNQLFELSKYQLKKGWNFIFITPSMVSSIFENKISGNCDIQGSYFFNPDTQEWVSYSVSSLVQEIDGPDDGDFTGLGWVIKVSSDCQLGSSVSSSDGPPGLPEEDTEEAEDILNLNANNFPNSIKDYENYHFKTMFKICEDYENKEICNVEHRIIYDHDNQFINIFIGKYEINDLNNLSYYNPDLYIESDYENIFDYSESEGILWKSGNAYILIEMAEWEDRDRFRMVQGSYNKPDIINPVVDWFLGKYSPEAII